MFYFVSNEKPERVNCRRRNVFRYDGNFLVPSNGRLTTALKAREYDSALRFLLKLLLRRYIYHGVYTWRAVYNTPTVC